MCSISRIFRVFEETLCLFAQTSPNDGCLLQSDLLLNTISLSSWTGLAICSATSGMLYSCSISDLHWESYNSSQSTNSCKSKLITRTPVTISTACCSVTSSAVTSMHCHLVDGKYIKLRRAHVVQWLIH